MYFLAVYKQIEQIRPMFKANQKYVRVLFWKISDNAAKKRVFLGAMKVRRLDISSEYVVWDMLKGIDVYFVFVDF